MSPANHLVLALATCLVLTGCNDTQDLAPASPDTPWQIPASSEPSPREIAPAANVPPANISPGHPYSLAELIDISERRNETTRIAWEQARQAAINVGIAQATLLPALTASAIGGYQHVALPFPSYLVSRGYITANIQELIPQLTISYLLLDFGGRQAAVNEARQLSLAANITFTGAHQKLIFDVARGYFVLNGADAQLRAAQQALRDAQEVQRSAEALYGRGLDTIVSVDLARRETAQRQYDVSLARTAQHDAVYGLLTAMDVPPTTQLRIVDISDRPLPHPASGTIQRLLEEALRQRPDVLAAVAHLRATDAGIAAARSAFLPKLSVSTNVNGNFGQFSVDGSPYYRVNQPQTGLFLHFDWPLYQGGLLQNRLREAQSQHDAAADALQESRNQALRQVALAADQLDTVLQQYDAAAALNTAAEASFSSATESYANGVGTLTDAMSAEAALAAARADVARAHAQSLVNAAALAFATGALNAGSASTLVGP